MIGAIIGDIVGSRFEWHNHRSKTFDFFSPDCFFTDDSIMTLAVAKAILVSDGQPQRLPSNTVYWMRKLGQPYPNSGYGGRFYDWMYTDSPAPYNSFGNGAAMRVSACGYAGRTLSEVRQLSAAVTGVTHNHPEGLKGAEATAVCIFMALHGESMASIRSHVQKYYYPLSFTLDEIRDSYRFNETCQETVPQAIEAFLESSSFEDAVRGAISIGGDSDTLAAITGSIAEAYYGVPAALRNQALTYLDDRLRNVLDEFEVRYGYPTPSQPQG